MFEHGLFDHPTQQGSIDFDSHAQVTRIAAEQSMVLLKNSRQLLPLDNNYRSIAIIGSHADVGVLSGGGSSQVYPPGGVAYLEKTKKHGVMAYHASSPLKALSARTKAKLTYNDGTDIKSAARVAKQNDAVIVFASQWNAEGFDHNLQLDGNQDELIEALVKANPNVIVVLETGGAVLMPWLTRVPAVLQAWYPGSSGGDAIARVLTGETNPAGHLPITFPLAVSQLARKVVDGDPDNRQARPEVNYNIDGATIGYKWYERNHLTPLFPFGFGLSYTSFSQSLTGADVHSNAITAHVTLKNIGKRDGNALAQIYVAPLNEAVTTQWEGEQRLGGFKKVELNSGGSTNISIKIDPRLLAVFDVASKHWVINEGDYEVRLSTDVSNIVGKTKVHLEKQIL